ncbi:MAG: hypothetical protein JWR54_3414 [Mucilaginibacter sp.]|nr:hypothetical protein [Mucilaginibacter sp.]
MDGSDIGIGTDKSILGVDWTGTVVASNQIYKKFNATNRLLTCFVANLSFNSELSFTPKAIKVKYKGKLKKVSLKRMGIEPAGAFLTSRNIIADEIKRSRQEWGEDQWQDNFTPSYEVICRVVDQFLYCPVTKTLWEEQIVKNTRLSLNLSVPEVMYIGKHFFNAYPNLIRPRTRLQSMKCYVKKWRL